MASAALALCRRSKYSWLAKPLWMLVNWPENVCNCGDGASWKNTRYYLTVGRFVLETESGTKPLLQINLSLTHSKLKERINNQWMSERVFLFLPARLIVKRWLGRLMKLYCFSETRWKQIYSIVIWKDSECRVVWGFHQWRKKKIAKFVGEFMNCRRIARVCLTILRNWHLNGLA